MHYVHLQWPRDAMLASASTWQALIPPRKCGNQFHHVATCAPCGMSARVLAIIGSHSSTAMHACVTRPSTRLSNMRASCMHRTVCMPLTAAGMKSLEDNIKDNCLPVLHKYGTASRSHINSHILPPTFILRIYIFTPYLHYILANPLACQF